MDLLFTIAAGTRQRSHSEVPGLRDSRPHFTISDSRLSKPGGPGPRIYILQEYLGFIIIFLLMVLEFKRYDFWDTTPCSSKLVDVSEEACRFRLQHFS
jgi:hypothetical protein